jgi:hypothetical protein
MAASSGGVVLSVDAAHHSIQVVDSHHAVHAYRYRGRLPRLHTGSTIHFQRSGGTIGHVKLASNKSSSVSYYARVLRSNARGLVVRLADGKTVRFSSKQLAHKRLKPSQRHRRHTGVARAASDLGLSAGGITVNIQGLQPGVTVLVNETVDDQGNVTVTITLPAATATGEQQASGVVNELDSDAFMLSTADGSLLRLHMAQDALAALNLASCDTVDVSYHQDAGLLIADSVQSTGTSTTGDCASEEDSQDTVGTITDVSPTGLTISTDQGPLTFSVDDPSITDGFALGDVVDVSYAQSSDGTLDAGDVEYVEQDASGTVTSVSDGSITITDPTGQQHTFTANPASGMFDGVALGDLVDVTYLQSLAGLVADVVGDPTALGDL